MISLRNPGRKAAQRKSRRTNLRNRDIGHQVRDMARLDVGDTTASGRTDAFAACFRNGRSWRSPHVSGLDRRGQQKVGYDLFAKPSGSARYLREAGTRRLGFDPSATLERRAWDLWSTVSKCPTLPSLIWRQPYRVIRLSDFGGRSARRDPSPVSGSVRRATLPTGQAACAPRSQKPEHPNGDV